MKKIKMWFELIFIFIIPLLVMLLTLQIQTINTYDENNNILTTEKTLEVNNISFLREYNDNLKYKYTINDFNIWDEQWELGIYNVENGAKVNSTTRIRTKNFIPVIPGTTYYKTTPNNGFAYILCYDTNKDFILVLYAGLGNQEFIIPDNCYFITSYVENNSYGTTYNNDICINISVSWANGNYNPYNEPLIINSNDNYTNGYTTKEINYTWYTKVFNNLFEGLQLEYNIILQLIITYTILWLIMFIIWHALYSPFDKLLHLLDKKE